MKTKSVVSFFLLCIISLILSACNLPAPHPLAPPTAQSNAEVSVTTISPPNGAVFALGSTINLTGLISPLTISAPTISGDEFLVNGASIAPASRSPGSFYGNWSPADTGEYYVQSKVTLADGTVAISEPARVCIVTSLHAAPSIGGYLGPCPLPTQIADHASSGNVALYAVAAPSFILFSADRISCPMANPTLTFIANVDDPQDLAALVIASFRNASGNDTEFRYLNWVTTRPVNQKEYRTTMEIPDAFSADDSIHWYVEVYSRNGEFLQRTQDVIPINHAECSNQPLEIAPPETPTFIPSFTPTPEILHIVPPTQKPKNDDEGDEPPPAQAEPTSQPAPCNHLTSVCP